MSGSSNSMHRRTHGFSLVELLTAIVISSLTLMATAALFSTTTSSRHELDRSTAMLENARWAQELLAQELRLAGFYGELAMMPSTLSLPDPCATATAALGWTASLPPVIPAAVVGIDGAQPTLPCIGDRQPGTDILVVRRASTNAVDVAAIDPSQVYVQVSRCTDDVAPVALGSDAATLNVRNIGCTAPTLARRYLVRIYYVSRCNVCGRDTTPTLKRLELDTGRMSTVALAEGIEDLQLEYGFDTDADASVETYLPGLDGVAGSTMNDWGNVVAVRLYLLARSLATPTREPDRQVYDLGAKGVVGPFGDYWKRMVLTSVSRLNNPAGRRE